ncbi:MAG: alpha-glucuronidase family glycosyl hydrolase, partial [Kiritimatiellae bacterium]|nr:alpha-glucuronidase family glycosyl hydrolase [Kiritimatiellia bacterium]
MDQKCKLMFLAAAVAFAAAGAEWKILEPAASSPAYAVAAREFQKYYEAVTGTSLSVIAEPAASDHLVVIGSDSVNRFARTAAENKIIPPLDVGADTDGYRIRSAEKDGRHYLFLAGGNGRGTLYAVYNFFEFAGTTPQLRFCDDVGNRQLYLKLLRGTHLIFHIPAEGFSAVPILSAGVDGRISVSDLGSVDWDLKAYQDAGGGTLTLMQAKTLITISDDAFAALRATLPEKCSLALSYDTKTLVLTVKPVR